MTLYLKLLIAITLVTVCYSDTGVCHKESLKAIAFTPDNIIKKDCKNAEPLLSSVANLVESTVMIIPDSMAYLTSLSEGDLIETKRILTLVNRKIKWILGSLNISACKEKILKFVDNAKLAIQVLAFGLVVLSSGLAVAGVFLAPFYGAGLAVTIGSVVVGLASAGVGVAAEIGSSVIKSQVEKYFETSTNLMSILGVYSTYLELSMDNIDMKLMSRSDEPHLYSIPSESLSGTFLDMHGKTGDGSIDITKFQTRYDLMIANMVDVDETYKGFSKNHNLMANCFIGGKQTFAIESKPIVSQLYRWVSKFTDANCCVMKTIKTYSESSVLSIKGVKTSKKTIREADKQQQIVMDYLYNHNVAKSEFKRMGASEQDAYHAAKTLVT